MNQFKVLLFLVSLFIAKAMFSFIGLLFCLLRFQFEFNGLGAFFSSTKNLSVCNTSQSQLKARSTFHLDKPTTLCSYSRSMFQHEFRAFFSMYILLNESIGITTQPAVGYYYLYRDVEDGQAGRAIAYPELVDQLIHGILCPPHHYLPTQVYVASYISRFQFCLASENIITRAQLFSHARLYCFSLLTYYLLKSSYTYILVCPHTLSHLIFQVFLQAQNQQPAHTSCIGFQTAKKLAASYSAFQAFERFIET